LITGVATIAIAKDFVAMWRLVRTYWLCEVLMNRKPPEFATRKAWKTFVAGSFTGTPTNLKSENSRVRVKFAEFLHLPKAIAITRENFVFDKEDGVVGTIDEKVSVEMVRETVRELSDLGFFFDMFEVEYYRTYDSPPEILERLRPAMFPCSLTVPSPIPRSTLDERATWLCRVRDFIEPWQGKKPEGFFVQLSEPPTDHEVCVLEEAVADVYCSNVTYILRRRPVIPRYKQARMS
jgi:hypothetical protein